MAGRDALQGRARRQTSQRASLPIEMAGLRPLDALQGATNARKRPVPTTFHHIKSTSSPTRRSYWPLHQYAIEILSALSLQGAITV